MTAKLDEDGTQRLHVKAPIGLIARIHAWRRRQEKPPNLSEAIRRLIEAGLDAEKKTKR